MAEESGDARADTAPPVPGRALLADAVQPVAGRALRADAVQPVAGRPLRADAVQPVPGRPLRADAARTREKVLRAARAGVGPGTVYRHFPAKEALFEAVATARVEDLLADARSLADSADPGGAFFGYLARTAEESAAKRDLPDAISIEGSLRDELNAALDLLLRRAQQAGAVRGDVRTPDLIVLLTGMFAGLAGTSDPALRDLVFTVLADGLRPPR